MKKLIDELTVQATRYVVQVFAAAMRCKLRDQCILTVGIDLSVGCDLYETVWGYFVVAAVGSCCIIANTATYQPAVILTLKIKNEFMWAALSGSHDSCELWEMPGGAGQHITLKFTTNKFAICLPRIPYRALLLYSLQQTKHD